jgi:hypothetical protein
MSTDTDFWTYVDCDTFAHLNEYYALLKHVTLFIHTLYT